MSAVKPTFSFELFPPKTENGETALMQEVPVLAALKPDFLTVTFGAGGSGRSGTLDLVTRIQAATKIPTAAHLTYICLTKGELKDFTDQLWSKGIHKIVALRGDLPAGWTPPDYAEGRHYRYTDEFVRALCAERDFDVSVAAYPEKHPDAPDLASDIDALKKKCDAGAARAITQFFFDNASYYRFLELAAKAGIDTPIYPGILPIMNFEKAVSFAERCGAHIPDHIRAKFAGLNDNDAAKAAHDLLVAQVQDLKAQGVAHFHFYTLNKAALSRAACLASGLAA
jgi:methylenetetrahydrofolate reductase (NADPH)